MTKKKRESRTLPQVGIFFWFEDKLWTESACVEKAGGHVDFKDHDGDHVTYWDRLISEGLVPEHVEYQDVPRGRVVFNTSTDRFHLMLDRCILRRKKIAAAIKKQMGLPAKATDTSTDLHYRCAECLVERGLD